LPYTLEEQRRRTNAALIIQNAWFNRLIRLSERSAIFILFAFSKRHFRNRLADVVEQKRKMPRSFHAQHSNTEFPDISLTELGVVTVDDEYEDDYSSDDGPPFPSTTYLPS
jgi:hypothetical protein